MPAMPVHKGRPGPRRQGLRRIAACFALALSGCASSITTPLPDLPKSHVSSSMTPQDRQKAVDELTRARDMNGKEAEEQIESSK